MALVVLDPDTAPAWAQANGLPFSSLPAFAAHPRVRGEVEQAVRAANQQVSHAEQIKRFTVLPVQWTTESELTPTLKLKRRVIQRKYAEELEALYR